MNLTDIASIIQVILGIGLVIFVHELGHFLAARWCGARVEVFSLGFGPRLFGWRRGDTLFQVAAVPLGGYVKVAGEYFDGTSPKEAGTLSALNVPQRFLYYSGGVIMNVIFALVVLPLVMFAGVPANAPVVGSPTPGQPAWQAGVPGGSRVLKVNGEDMIDFEQIVTTVAVNGKTPLIFEVEVPESLAGDDSGERIRTFELEAEFNEDLGLYQVGIPFGIDPSHRVVVAPDSAAAKAGLTSGEILLGVVGQASELTLEQQLYRAVGARSSMTLRVQAAGGGQERTVEIVPKMVATDRKLIGISPAAQVVDELRLTGRSGPLLTALGLARGDRLYTVNGMPVTSRGELLTALLAGKDLDQVTMTMTVIRGGAVEALSAVIPDGISSVTLASDISLMPEDDKAVINVLSGMGADRAGMRNGDEVISIDNVPTSSWEEVLKTIRAKVEKGQSMEVLAYRGLPDPVTGTREEVRVELTGEAREEADYGLFLRAATFTLKADGFGDAVAMGVFSTKRFLIDVGRQLKKMLFSDELSTKNLGGIITISVISFDTASQGLSKLFFFLAILSINLAIINLLPVPILDGGHLLFLLIEAIKGSPVSERAFGYSQVVGLVMIMSLMVYVTYQDIVRWILPG